MTRSALQPFAPLAAAWRRLATPAFQLDFLHPTPLARHSVAALVVGVLALGAVTLHGLSLLSQRDALEHRLAEDTSSPRHKRIVAPPLSATQAKSLAQQAQQVDIALASLAMPWDSWFGHLEAATSPAVMLVALQPEANGQRVRLSGQAQHFDDLTDYMSRLQSSGGFADVMLTEHNVSPDAAGGVAFTLTAEWAHR